MFELLHTILQQNDSTIPSFPIPVTLSDGQGQWNRNKTV